MARRVPGPLSEADYKKINDALMHLENTQGEVQRAMEAGMECGEYDQMCNDLKTRLNRIKGVYFPEHP